MNQVIQKMVAKQPSDRFGKPADVGESLEPLAIAVREFICAPGGWGRAERAISHPCVWLRLKPAPCLKQT